MCFFPFRAFSEIKAVIGQLEKGLPELASDRQRIPAPAPATSNSSEYNSSITRVLKNAIDWASRAESDDEPPLVAYRGKAAALLSASPSALGGLRGLVHLRAILGNIEVAVLPNQVTIPPRTKLSPTARSRTSARRSKSPR